MKWFSLPQYASEFESLFRSYHQQEVVGATSLFVSTCEINMVTCKHVFFLNYAFDLCLKETSCFSSKHFCLLSLIMKFKLADKLVK